MWPVGVVDMFNKDFKEEKEKTVSTERNRDV